MKVHKFNQWYFLSNMRQRKALKFRKETKGKQKNTLVSKIFKSISLQPLDLFLTLQNWVDLLKLLSAKENYGKYF